MTNLRYPLCSHHVPINEVCDTCGEAPTYDTMDDFAASNSHIERIITEEELLAGLEPLIHPPSATKPSNPKDALGIKKVPFTTISWTVLAELGVAMLEGALKYGRHNYRSIGVRASVYIDAANRHMASFWEGEDIDPDSGLSHITKAIASLVVLRDSMIKGNWTDDRPPRPPAGWMAKLNEKVSDLLKKYPDPVLPYTEADNSWIESTVENKTS